MEKCGRYALNLRSSRGPAANELATQAGRYAADSKCTSPSQKPPLTCLRPTGTNESLASVLVGPIMTNRFLALALAMTQCVSWGASPLYLCVGSEGSVSFDLGHENCRCRHEPDEESVCDTDRHAACEGAAGCRHGDDVPGETADDCQIRFDPCGCRHYQILHQQGPLVVRSSAKARQANQFVAQDWALPLSVAVTPGDSQGLCSTTRPVPPPGMMLRAPVVLRC